MSIIRLLPLTAIALAGLLLGCQPGSTQTQQPGAELLAPATDISLKASAGSCLAS